jgi:hypothetical protein
MRTALLVLLVLALAGCTVYPAYTYGPVYGYPAYRSGYGYGPYYGPTYYHHGYYWHQFP